MAWLDWYRAAVCVCVQGGEKQKPDESWDQSTHGHTSPRFSSFAASFPRAILSGEGEGTWGKNCECWSRDGDGGEGATEGKIGQKKRKKSAGQKKRTAVGPRPTYGTDDVGCLQTTYKFLWLSFFLVTKICIIPLFRVIAAMALTCVLPCLPPTRRAVYVGLRPSVCCGRERRRTGPKRKKEGGGRKEPTNGTQPSRCTSGSRCRAGGRQ